jgi:hypothetical protein
MAYCGVEPATACRGAAEIGRLMFGGATPVLCGSACPHLAWWRLGFPDIRSSRTLWPHDRRARMKPRRLVLQDGKQKTQADGNMLGARAGQRRPAQNLKASDPICPHDMRITDSLLAKRTDAFNIRRSSAACERCPLKKRYEMDALRF